MVVDQEVKTLNTPGNSKDKDKPHVENLVKENTLLEGLIHQ